MLYLPHLDRMWRVMTPSAQETLVSLLSDVLPTLPLLVLAIIEDSLKVRSANMIFVDLS